ncbi:MAG: hypothetical protein K6E16_11630 [Lachnospiraceae bacterium]|nr:hypothetical protein [Lachnospiraceae bacterium]
MAKNRKNRYKEVRLENNGRGADRFYKNPLTGTYRYEYALYMAISNLFESVRYRSMNMESLRLYFEELPCRKDTTPAESEAVSEREKGRRTREDLLEEMEKLVAKDVVGHVTFPMMNICAAEAKAIPEADGSHSFAFSDGVYGFVLHLDFGRSKHPKKIEVKDLYPKEVMLCEKHWISTKPVCELRPYAEKRA